MTRPYLCCAQAARSAVNGKYKTAPKKAVNDSTKEQLGQIHSLNRLENHRSRSRRAKCLSFLRNYEEFLMNLL